MAAHSSILSGKSHGQRSLAGYSPWGHKEPDTTEHEHTCGMWDLNSRPGIEPASLVVGAQSLNHWTAREVPEATAYMRESRVTCAQGKVLAQKRPEKALCFHLKLLLGTEIAYNNLQAKIKAKKFSKPWGRRRI